jgi:16S rRNA pseudouridine516 synthase
MLKRSRLDRYIFFHAQIPKSRVRLAVAKNQVWINGFVATKVDQPVSMFDHIQIGEREITPQSKYYLMLNKPSGIVSATQDSQFRTVIDCIPASICPHPSCLHYAGRLDRASTGLMLLTNDGHWSKKVSSAQAKIKKYYRVGVANPLKDEDVEAFSHGFYFATEQAWTRPAKLQILSDREAIVVIEEGRYHQIKRMFARVGNKVLTLHRYRIGELSLDLSLKPGECRPLYANEIGLFSH